MLRANIGISRKVSRDYQSTGYTVNLDGEIPFATDDSEGVLGKIRELFDLAHEALSREIDRDQGDAAVGRRDEPTPIPPVALPAKPKANGRIAHQPTVIEEQPAAPPRLNGHGSPNGHRNGTSEPATNAQIKYLLTMGKRLKLSTPQINSEIAKIVGREVGIYDLTKKEAGLVLDFWTTQVTA
jgi:hypothetical protein